MIFTDGKSSETILAVRSDDWSLTTVILDPGSVFITEDRHSEIRSCPLKAGITTSKKSLVN
jgi:hypothetical protein